MIDQRMAGVMDVVAWLQSCPQGGTIRDALANLVEVQITRGYIPRKTEPDQRSTELAEVREEIRLRSEVLRAFPDCTPVNSPGGAEFKMQMQRMVKFLARERELMKGAKP